MIHNYDIHQVVQLILTEKNGPKRKKTGDAKHKINSFRPKLSPPFYYLLKPGSNTEMKL